MGEIRNDVVYCQCEGFITYVCEHGLVDHCRYGPAFCSKCQKEIEPVFLPERRLEMGESSGS